MIPPRPSLKRRQTTDTATGSTGDRDSHSSAPSPFQEEGGGGGETPSALETGPFSRPAPVIATRATTMGDNTSRLTRFAGYLYWSVADQVVMLGIPRLILFPILAALLGVDAFGSFVIALGIIQLVGLAPSNGLVGYVIRDLVREDAPRQALLLRTTLILTVAAVEPLSRKCRGNRRFVTRTDS